MYQRQDVGPFFGSHLPGAEDGISTHCILSREQRTGVTPLTSRLPVRQLTYRREAADRPTASSVLPLAAGPSSSYLQLANESKPVELTTLLASCSVLTSVTRP